jgi:hypothetical protein
MKITRTSDGEAFHHGLQASVRSVSYDFRRQRGRLDMEELCCCDMSGCIALFKAIDSKVREIETFADGKRDTTYVQQARGGWQAVAT